MEIRRSFGLFEEAEANARRLGQNLASLLIDTQPAESLESRVSKLECQVAKIEDLLKAISRWASQEGLSFLFFSIHQIPRRSPPPRKERHAPGYRISARYG